MALPPPPPGFVIDSQGNLGRPVIRANPQPAPRHPDDARKSQIDASTAAATQPDVIAKTRAERIAAERAADPNRAPEVVKRRADDRDQLADYRVIAQQLNRVQELFNKDLRGKSVGKSVGQLLPTPKMQRFEAQSGALAVLLKPLIRGPGEGPWTDKDQALLDRLTPSRLTSDVDNMERIEAVKRFLSGKAKKHGGRVRSVRPEPEQPQPEQMGLPDGWSIEED